MSTNYHCQGFNNEVKYNSTITTDRVKQKKNKGTVVIFSLIVSDKLKQHHKKFISVNKTFFLSIISNIVLYDIENHYGTSVKM